MESGINKLAALLQGTSGKFKFFKNKIVCFSKPNDQRKESHDTIPFDNKVIKSNEFEYLGKTIDSSLSFLNQVKQSLRNVTRDKN